MGRLVRLPAEDGARKQRGATKNMVFTLVYIQQSDQKKGQKKQKLYSVVGICK